METLEINRQQFDKGIRLFVEILATQPGLLKLEPGVNDVKGKALANMAAEFSKEYNRIRMAHSDGSA